MKLKIYKQIFEKFPGLHVGVVIAKHIDNTTKNEEILELLKQQQKMIKQNFQKETLSENPKIDAWRKAYSIFGAKPKKYKCSVENLYRMILDDIDLKHINKLVDIYNYISIKHLVPVGGDDLDKVEGNITLTFAKGDEVFNRLNSEESAFPHQGEVIYKDDKEVLCRRWNWRESDKSKMTEHTKNVSLVVEGLPPLTKDEIQKIIAELASLVKKYCAGEVKTVVLDEKSSETEF